MNIAQARTIMIEFLGSVVGVTDKWPLWTQEHTKALRIVLGINEIGTSLTYHDLIVGKMYRVVHKAPTEKLPRESAMGYLGEDPNGYLSFNARPLAGTQAMPKSWILSITEAPPGLRVYLNKIVRKTV